MGHGIRYLALWSATTTVAVALSWLGVRSVLDAGVPQPPVVMAGPTQQQTSTVVAETTTTIATTTTAPPPPPETTTPTTTAVPAPVRTTPPPPPEDGAWTRDSYVRSFQLAGGETAVRFSPEGTEPISATPRQGFAVTVRESNGTLVVEFQDQNRRSRLEASWEGGPRWKIVEAG